MSGNSNAAKVLRRIVRGQQAISDLDKAGIDLIFRREDGNEFVEVENQSGVTFRVRPRDIARGLLALEDDPEPLRTWATFLLSGTDALDFSSFEDSETGEVLLDILWDASFNGTVSDEAIEVAKEIA